MEGYHEYAGGQFDVQVIRVDDKVVLYFYRDGELLVQITTNRAATVNIAQKMLGVLA
jgi:hypothetical protein